MTTLGLALPSDIEVFVNEKSHIPSVSGAHPLILAEPESVTSLMLSATHTSNITVQWTPPADFKGGYKYNVSSSNGESHVIEKNEFTFTNLVAGSNYNFSVQTLTADNTAGAVKNVMGCTGEHWSHSSRMQKHTFGCDYFSRGMCQHVKMLYKYCTDIYPLLQCVCIFYYVVDVSPKKAQIIHIYQ